MLIGQDHSLGSRLKKVPAISLLELSYRNRVIVIEPKHYEYSFQMLADRSSDLPQRFNRTSQLYLPLVKVMRG